MTFPRPTAAQLFAAWCIAVALVLTVVVIPAVAGFEVPPAQTPRATTVEGRVATVLERSTIESGRGPLQHERLAVETGSTTVTIERDRNPRDIGSLDVEVGDRVLLARTPTPAGDAYYIVDRIRTDALWLLGGAFVLMALVIGRLHGATAILGLAASLLVILRFIIPGILSGHDPRVIAVSGALVIMCTTLFLAHGISLKSMVALAGTALALLVTATLAGIAISGARLTGIVSEDAATLQVLARGNIQATGVLFGGIIIGALGVLDDVTVAQASAVFELRRANVTLGAFELYRRAMNVGRDHIAATINTLVLAYAGASLPLLMLLVLQQEALGLQLSREFIAVEVVRSLVGSMGLIAAVPLTTAFAALVAHRVPADAPALAPESGE